MVGQLIPHAPAELSSLPDLFRHGAVPPGCKLVGVSLQGVVHIDPAVNPGYSYLSFVRFADNPRDTILEATVRPLKTDWIPEDLAHLGFDVGSLTWQTEPQRKPARASPFLSEVVREKHVGQICFIEAPDVGLVKIGRSYDAEWRLKQLQLMSPCRLRLLKAVAGAPATERRFHRRFAAQRDHGEWFVLNEELRNFIEELE